MGKERKKGEDSTEENEADDDVMKKIKALKKVEKILQKELEARRKKREHAESTDSSDSEVDRKTKSKKKQMAGKRDKSEGRKRVLPIVKARRRTESQTRRK